MAIERASRTKSGSAAPAAELGSTSGAPHFSVGWTAKRNGRSGQDSVPSFELSVIIPTRNEAGNIEELVTLLEQSTQRVPTELIFVDDSTDATPQVVSAVARRSRLAVSLIHRPPELRADGLGGAVREGMRKAAGQWICIMDADLQHPPHLIPDLLDSAESGRADIVVASRYVESGDANGLGAVRGLTSRLCTAVTRLLFLSRLRNVKDPLSGYFLFRRDAVDPEQLRPRGFKILLEILGRFPHLRISEIPMRFGCRFSEQSKGTIREGMRFLIHLLTLRFGPLVQRLARFGLVGASGLVVNTLLLATFTSIAELHYVVSAALSTLGSTAWNFSLIDKWVFAERNRDQPKIARFAPFLLMNSAALLLRAPFLVILTSGLGVHYLVSNLITLLALAIARYVFSDRWIWPEPAVGPRESAFHYDIHGIIRVCSEVRLPELEYFRAAVGAEEPDVRVRLGLPRRQRSAAERGTTFRYRELPGPLGFWVEVNIGRTMDVSVGRLLKWSPHVLYTNVVEPILRWKLVPKGYALIHGACVAADNQAAVVTAPTDTGKTTTVLRLLTRYPYSFLSDDMVIASGDGHLRCYPKPLTISRHTLEAVDGTRLSRWQKIALRVQSRVHSKSGRRTALNMARLPLPMATINSLAQIIVPPPKYMIDQLIPDVAIQHDGAVSHLVAIDHGPALEVSLERGLALETLLRNCEDAYGFPPYAALERFLPFWNGEDLRQKEREIISAALNRCPATLIQSETRDWWERLPTILGSIRSKPAKRIASKLTIAPAPRLEPAEQWVPAEPSRKHRPNDPTAVNDPIE